MTKRTRLSDLTVKAEDCYDPADYVLVHKVHFARLQRGAARPAGGTDERPAVPQASKERTATDVRAYLRAVLERHTPESGYTSVVCMDVDLVLLLDALESKHVETTAPHCEPLDIDPARLITGLRELSVAFVEGRQDRYGMRIPAEPYHDGDIVCGSAARLIERLLAELLKLESHIVDVYNAQEAAQSDERELFSQVGQLLAGWKQGCSQGEWSDFDEQVLLNWQAWRFAAASRADVPAAKSWTAGDGPCNCDASTGKQVYHDAWCRSLVPPVDVSGSNSTTEK